MPREENDVQIKVTGRVKENQAGGEVLCFTFPLFGAWQVVCIANIPTEEQENRAPVYVKILPRRPRDETRSNDENADWRNPGGEENPS